MSKKTTCWQERGLPSLRKCLMTHRTSCHPQNLFSRAKGRAHPPEGVYVQWAPKGSYRLETMLGTISHLRNRSNIFTHRDYALYILDDYSVHVMPEVKQAFLARGYILVCSGGGVTGDVQVNDTHVHHLLKKEYRERESKLMLQQLTENRNKVPNPSRDDMMKMLNDSWQALILDPIQALKNNFVSNSFDGSEDYLVHDKLFSIVGEQMVAFREYLLDQPVPNSLQDLLKTLTPPKGVHLRKDEDPPDEGRELLDCEGEELEGDPEESEEADHTDVEIHYGEPPENDVPNDAGNAASTTSKKNINTGTPSQGNATSLLKTCNDMIEGDDYTKCDAAFLDKLKDVLEKTETSPLFLPFRTQLEVVYCRARSSLKKRVTSAQTNFLLQKKLNQAETEVNGGSVLQQSKQNEGESMLPAAFASEVCDDDGQKACASQLTKD